MLEYTSDGGYQTRRALASRPRQRYTLEYLGKNTQELRYLRDFLLFHRLGVTPFQYLHSTAHNTVPVTNTTPVWLQYQHGLITGSWVNIGGGIPALVGQWQVTRVDSLNVILNGSTAAGPGNVIVSNWLPYAVARFNENTWESPAKLLGPERLSIDGQRPGYFSWSVVVEEVF